MRITSHRRATSARRCPSRSRGADVTRQPFAWLGRECTLDGAANLGAADTERFGQLRRALLRAPLQLDQVEFLT